MTPTAHAVLSPSGAERWYNCTPSARLEQQFPETSGEAAKEGTHAHALAELLVRRRAGLITEADFQTEFTKLKDSKYYDNAMFEHCDNYAVFVMETLAAAKVKTPDALLFLEQRLNLTDYIPEGFGTGDTVIIADHTMYIIDLKYGKGVPVSAEDNKQMKLYSLGALREFDFVYDIQNVSMTIYQPRLDTISTWELLVADLRNWADSELKPRAALAFEGKGAYQPGAHCRFCKAKAVCRANADYNLEVAQYDFKPSELLEPAEVSDILRRADNFYKWLNAVEEYALHQSVNNGVKWPGFKIVEGKSNRVYTDEAKVVDTLVSAGIDKEALYKPQEIIGITQMEKLLGKPNFTEYLKGLVIKPKGKLALVPEADKRPEYNSTASAQEDFENN